MELRYCLLVETSVRARLERSEVVPYVAFLISGFSPCTPFVTARAKSPQGTSQIVAGDGSPRKETKISFLAPQARAQRSGAR
jgi:hypothetical protein